tara:strand:- start:4313 stop:4564 length:252 start_codon:yes stop_codon:yes gene_type:complete
MPDSTMIWNLLLTLGCGSFVWWIRGLSNKIESLEKNLFETKEDVAKNYASKSDMRVSMDDLAKRFDKLEEKLDAILLKIRIDK